MEPGCSTAIIKTGCINRYRLMLLVRILAFFCYETVTLQTEIHFKNEVADGRITALFTRV
jgi:hypothetical protein